MKDRYILAFETSCDETSVAVLKNDDELLSNVIASQIDISSSSFFKAATLVSSQDVKLRVTNVLGA